jgi:hypothetical protein
MQTIKKTPRILSFALWAVQISLSAGLIWAGFTKLFTPSQTLAEMWPWTAAHQTLVIVTGFADLISGIGIILPSFFKGKDQLVTATAFGIITLMLAATSFHIIRGEISQIGINVVFAALAGFVIWGRSRNL